MKKTLFLSAILATALCSSAFATTATVDNNVHRNLDLNSASYSSADTVIFNITSDAQKQYFANDGQNYSQTIQMGDGSETQGGMWINDGYGNEVTFSGALTGSGMIKKTGAGTGLKIAFTGDATAYTGNIILNAANTFTLRFGGEGIAASETSETKGIAGTGDVTFESSQNTLVYQYAAAETPVYITNTISKTGNNTAKVELQGGATFKFAKDATIDQLTIGAGTTLIRTDNLKKAALKGSGTYVLAAGNTNLGSNITLANDWSGWVEIASVDSNNHQTGFSAFGNNIKMHGYSGWNNDNNNTAWNGTEARNFYLTNHDTFGYAWRCGAFSSDSSITGSVFTGTWSGDGTFLSYVANDRYMYYTYGGDIEGWTGKFQLNAQNAVTSRVKLTFTDNATAVNAAIENTKGSLNVIADTEVTFAKTITASSLTINAEKSANLSNQADTIDTLTVNGSLTGAENLKFKSMTLGEGGSFVRGAATVTGLANGGSVTLGDTAKVFDVNQAGTTLNNVALNFASNASWDVTIENKLTNVDFSLTGACNSLNLTHADNTFKSFSVERGDVTLASAITLTGGDSTINGNISGQIRVTGTNTMTINGTSIGEIRTDNSTGKLTLTLGADGDVTADQIIQDGNTSNPGVYSVVLDNNGHTTTVSRWMTVDSVTMKNGENLSLNNHTIDKLVVEKGDSTVSSNGTISLANHSIRNVTVNDGASLTFAGQKNATIQSLTLGTDATMTLGTTVSHDNTLTTTTLTVSGASTLNANLVVSANGTMDFSDAIATGTTLTMGCSVEIGDNVTVVIDDSIIEGIVNRGETVAIITDAEAITSLDNKTWHFQNAAGQSLDWANLRLEVGADGTSIVIAPEPATATLSLLALAALASRRKRH